MVFTKENFYKNLGVLFIFYNCKKLASAADNAGPTNNLYYSTTST